MQGLYQGGQCNPNAIGATSNHFKRAMNVIAVGGQNPERVIEHAQKGVNFEGDIQAREMMFKAMGEQWGQASIVYLI